MILIEEPQLKKIKAYATDVLGKDVTGHNMEHVERVVRHAKKIQQLEGGDLFIVLASAYLHDVLDDKLIEDEALARENLSDFLASIGLSIKQMTHIFDVIDHVSFSGQLDKEGEQPLTKEAKIVQDADRLDAIGAIGIARTFYYGGKKGHTMHDKQIMPREEMTKEDYRQNMTVINHFYEKLFKLQDMMQTKTGKELGEKRTAFMKVFIDEFLMEWNG